jgi:hypothetical protein
VDAGTRSRGASDREGGPFVTCVTATVIDRKPGLAIGINEW